MRFARWVVAAVMLAGIIAQASATEPSKPTGHPFYRSVDGEMVHQPTAEPNAAYGPVSAICGDGTTSYSHHVRGTCTHHGGVAEWKNRPAS